MAEGRSPSTITGAAEFADAFSVSRETIEKLKTYEFELKRWQKAVNLVSPTTLDQIWHRHFADSAQLASLISDTTRHSADIGSGGGFPGLVLAVLCQSRRDFRVTLVESDTRKAAFLRETARRMEIPVEILSTRIESDASVNQLNDVDTITARAFAPFDRLFGLVSPVFGSDTVGLFLKGRDVDREIEDAASNWSFDIELHESLTDSGGRIAIVRNLVPKTEGDSHE
ncbi:MAG: 16S rRNA (guanine(527)-N(7))-methyltransferase RsmG [Pseudomonadota bacterium]